MTKQEFLAQLRNGLSGLPQDDIEDRLIFYGEMIDDRMEDGLLEEDAVFRIGAVEDVISQIIADTPLTRLVRETIKPKKALRAWEIVLLAVGSPIYLALIIAIAAVLLAVYAVLWAVLIALWATEAALCCCVPGGIAMGIVAICGGHGLTGIAIIGAGIVCAGLAVFLFFGCKAATTGILQLSKKIAVRIKHCFIRKETAQ